MLLLMKKCCRQRLKRNPGAIVGFLFVLLFVVCAIFAPWLAPHKPLDQDLSLLGAGGIPPGPSLEHWFGVDTLGRDEFSRIIYGARLSLLVGVVSVATGLTVGMVFGSLAGYLGGIVDTVIMRTMDVVLAIPGRPENSHLLFQYSTGQRFRVFRASNANALRRISIRQPEIA